MKSPGLNSEPLSIRVELLWLQFLGIKMMGKKARVRQENVQYWRRDYLESVCMYATI